MGQPSSCYTLLPATPSLNSFFTFPTALLSLLFILTLVLEELAVLVLVLGK